MTILTNFPALPNRIAIACEFLQGSGEEGVPRELFEGLISPESGGTDDDGNTGTTSMAQLVLRELEALGLAVSAGSAVRLTPEIDDKPMNYLQWLEWLPNWLEPRLSDPEMADAHQQGGVPRAIAWLLSQDSQRPIRSSGAHADLLKQQLGDVAGLGFNMRNDQIFQNLVYWTRYLGFSETIGFRVGSATSGSSYVVADPTRAIARALPHIFGDGRELAISKFVERLSEVLPVLEEGIARVELEQRLVANWRRGAQHFSRSTSLALKRLVNNSTLKLTVESDGERWVMEDGQDAQSVSRVTWSGARA
jgi:hypothetical protein